MSSDDISVAYRKYLVNIIDCLPTNASDMHKENIFVLYLHSNQNFLIVLVNISFKMHEINVFPCKYL